MRKRKIYFALVILVAVSMLAACGPQVRIEPAPSTIIITAATTAVPAVTTASTQPTGPAGTTPSGTTETRPSAGTVAPRASTPVVVLESDEIVPIPDTLLRDLNRTLDDLIVSIGRLESPDEDILVFP